MNWAYKHLFWAEISVLQNTNPTVGVKAKIKEFMDVILEAMDGQVALLPLQSERGESTLREI